MIEKHTTNSEITLNSYIVNLLDKEGTILAEGEVTSIQKIRPRSNFVFSGKFKLKGDIGALSSLEVIKCNFIDLDQTVDIILIKTELGKEFSATFIISKPPLVFDKKKKLISIKFNLLNFNKELNKFDIEFSEWRLKLEKIVSNKEYEELSKVGGFLVTHKGEITKVDNTKFAVKDAELITDFLYKLFSFCKGVSTPAFLVEGFDSNNELAWYEIGGQNLHSWRKCHNWFSDSRIDFRKFVPGFYDFCQKDPFKT